MIRLLRIVIQCVLVLLLVAVWVRGLDVRPQPR
jgi:hypothetical protein